MSVGFYSVEDARKRLGKTERELRELAKDGRLNMVEDGDAAWFSAADVDELGGGADHADVPIDLSLEAVEDDVAIAPPKKREEEKDITEIPIALEEEENPEEDGMSKIRSFSGTGLASTQSTHDTSQLKRNVIHTGSGATRCRTFHAKLNDASLGYLNNQINEWIDGDPTIEIKFATSSIGVVEGKHAESHLIVTLFY